MIKVRKIKLIPVADTPAGRTSIYNYVKNIASDLSKIGNEVIRIHVGNQAALDDLIKNRKISKKEANDIFKEKLGHSIRHDGYNHMKTYTHISSSIRTSFNTTIYKTISNNFYDIVSGKMSIPSFRKLNMTIPFNLSSTDDKLNFIYRDEKYYYINFPLSLEHKDMEIKFSMFFGKDKGGVKIIVDRVMSGEYKLCDSSFKVEDNNVYFILTYDQPTVIPKTMDPDKVMGVDLGINRPVTFYIKDQKNQPQQIEIGLKIQHDRVRFQKHKRSLQQSMKYSKGGHGRYRKTEMLDTLRKKESDWAQTMNHKISSELVKIAQDNNVGIIKLEDLVGITKNSTDYFMKSWAHDQLQTFITYKAKQVGITVLKVDPKNTSITCNKCGHSDKENRNDKDRTKFRCQNFECDDYNVLRDADLVAAYNISHIEDGSEHGKKSKKGRMETYQNKKNKLKVEDKDRFEEIPL